MVGALLFLDVKGAFNDVNPYRVAEAMDIGQAGTARLSWPLGTHWVLLKRFYISLVSGQFLHTVALYGPINLIKFRPKLSITKNRKIFGRNLY